MVPISYNKIHILVGFDGTKKLFRLNNGDELLTIVLDNNDNVFILTSPTHEWCSCFWNNQAISGPPSHALPIGREVISLTALILSKHAHLSMDCIDQWKSLVNDDRYYTLDDPVEVLCNMIRVKSSKVGGVALFEEWKLSGIKRWHGKADPIYFILDLLYPLIGPSIISILCARLSIETPKTMVELLPASNEQAALKKGRRTNKITVEDTKGHKSLTAFFKPRLQAQ